MLNAEKFKEEIKKVNYNFALVNNKVVLCFGTDCKSCRFYDGCKDKTTEWLLSEYEPPKIEPEVYNLKCDDRVEVSDDGKHWLKRHFKCIENIFVVAWGNGATSFSADGECDVTKWTYARIPREE